MMDIDLTSDNDVDLTLESDIDLTEESDVDLTSDSDIDLMSDSAGDIDLTSESDEDVNLKSEGDIDLTLDLTAEDIFSIRSNINEFIEKDVDLTEDMYLTEDIDLEMSSETLAERKERVERERLEAEELEKLESDRKNLKSIRNTMTPLQSINKLEDNIYWIKNTLKPYGQDAISGSDFSNTFKEDSFLSKSYVSKIGIELAKLVGIYVETISNEFSANNSDTLENITVDYILNYPLLGKTTDEHMLKSYIDVISGLSLDSSTCLLEPKYEVDDNGEEVLPKALKDVEIFFNNTNNDLTLLLQLQVFLKLCSDKRIEPGQFFQYIEVPYPTLSSLPLSLELNIQLLEVITAEVKKAIKFENAYQECTRQLTNLIAQKSKILEIPKCKSYVYVPVVKRCSFICGSCGKESAYEGSFFNIFLSHDLNSKHVYAERLEGGNILNFPHKCEHCGTGNMISRIEAQRMFESFISNSGHSAAYRSFNDFLGKYNSRGDYGLYSPPFEFMQRFESLIFVDDNEDEVSDYDLDLPENSTDKLYELAVKNYLSLLNYLEEPMVEVPQNKDTVDDTEDIWGIDSSVQIDELDVTAKHTRTLDDLGISEFNSFIKKVCNNLKVDDITVKNCRNTATVVSFLCNKEYKTMYNNAKYSLVKFLYTQSIAGQYLKLDNLCLTKSRSIYNIDNLKAYIKDLENAPEYDRIMTRLWDIFDVDGIVLKAYKAVENDTLGKPKEDIANIQERNRTLIFDAIDSAKKSEKEFLGIRKHFSKISDFTYLLSYIVIEEENKNIQNSQKLDDIFISYSKELQDFIDFTSNLIILRNLSNEFFDYFIESEWSKTSLNSKQMKTINDSKLLKDGGMIPAKIIKNLSSGDTDKYDDNLLKLCSAFNSYYKMKHDDDSEFFGGIGKVLCSMHITNVDRVYFLLANIASAYKSNDVFSFCKSICSAESFIYETVGVSIKEHIDAEGVKKIIKESCEKVGYPFRDMSFLTEVLDECKAFVEKHGRSELDHIIYYFGDKFDKKEIEDYLDTNRINLDNITKMPVKIEGESFSNFYDRFYKLNIQGTTEVWDYTTLHFEMLDRLKLYSLEFDCMDLPYNYSRVYSTSKSDNVYNAPIFNLLFFGIFAGMDILELLLHVDMKLFVNSLCKENGVVNRAISKDKLVMLCKELYINNMIFGYLPTDLLYLDIADDASKQLSKNVLVDDSNITIDTLWEAENGTIKDLVSEEFYNSLFDLDQNGKNEEDTGK